MGLESLEAREVPAIVFVGGWGASSYQYATADTSDPAAAVPLEQPSLNFAKVEYDAAAATGAGDDVYQWDPGDGADAASSGYIRVKKLNSG